MSTRSKLLVVALIAFLLGTLVAQNLPYALGQPAGAGPKVPSWLHGMNLKSRKFDEGDFSDKTKKYGIEVFKDENNGNLIYISETGSIAVVPGK
jgi:hypothetical protein